MPLMEMREEAASMQMKKDAHRVILTQILVLLHFMMRLHACKAEVQGGFLRTRRDALRASIIEMDFAVICQNQNAWSTVIYVAIA
jgi:hypothetical protein